MTHLPDPPRAPLEPAGHRQRTPRDLATLEYATLAITVVMALGPLSTYAIFGS